MPQNTVELLVVLAPGVSSEVLSTLSSAATIVQKLPHRLFLVRARVDAIDELRGVPGVIGVYREAPEAIPSDFSEAERLFVSAWALHLKAKKREHDGSPWDAPGRLPPDHPRRRS